MSDTASDIQLETGQGGGLSALGAHTGPVVVGANWYRFGSSEHIHHDLVVSLSYVWVVLGSGTITVNGRPFRMTSQSVLQLPWRHAVDYLADSKSPFHVGTLHVIPWHDRRQPVVPQVAFSPGGSLPLFDMPERRGPSERGVPAMSSALSGPGRNVITLATYAVERFISAPYDERVFRALGELIMAESDAWTRVDQHRTSPVMEAMADFVTKNLHRHITVAEVAAAGRCSTTTAERVFAEHTGQSVLAWVNSRKINEAALLLRTTGLRSSEVAQRVGFSDPLYFSRVFRTALGVPPSRYAVGQLRP